MAKDGTNRGGRRIRAGDKPLPLTDKITRGKAAKILEATDFNPESLIAASDLDAGDELADADMPNPSE
ncbi:MAG: terminase, partial [Kiritimatiellae bacterium]|nr:terminase [Kiritimatiellia bacterium]